MRRLPGHVRACRRIILDKGRRPIEQLPLARHKVVSDERTVQPATHLRRPAVPLVHHCGDGTIFIGNKTFDGIANLPFRGPRVLVPHGNVPAVQGSYGMYHTVTSLVRHDPQTVLLVPSR